MSAQIKSTYRSFKERFLAIVFLNLGFIFLLIIGELVFRLPGETVAITCSLIFFFGIALSPFAFNKAKTKKDKKKSENIESVDYQRTIRLIKYWRNNSLNTDLEKAYWQYRKALYIHDILNGVTTKSQRPSERQIEPKVFGNITEKPRTQEEVIRQALRGEQGTIH